MNGKNFVKTRLQPAPFVTVKITAKGAFFKLVQTKESMNIGIIDADLIGLQEHNFPNLACMKISSYHKKQNDNTRLITYSEIQGQSLFTENFDKVYISKVFTITKVPNGILNLSFVKYGGTGFFFDKAENLPYEIEHSFPDYNLYNNWIKEKILLGKKEDYFKYYTDFSIGFLTRGCFRKCDFCVNKKYNKVFLHSPLSEFVDKSRPKICLYDDNFLGYKDCVNILKELQATKKPFQFKGGLDIRTMTEDRAKLLSESKYVGNFIFAFDNIKDKNIIEKKLAIWNKYVKNERTVLYTLCGFDRNNKYDYDFWLQDIIDLFERTRILMKYDARPYVMRFERWKESPFYQLYVFFSQWTNGTVMFYATSFRENAKNHKSLIDFENKYPEIAAKYFDMKVENIAVRMKVKELIFNFEL